MALANTRQRQLNQTLRQFYDRPVAKVSLELIFSLVAVMIFAMFAIRPTLITMSNLVKEIQDKEKLHEQLKQKIAALSSAQIDYATLGDRLAVLDEALPSTPQFQPALATLEKLASERKLLIISIEAKEVPKETLPTDMAKSVRISKPITITVMGDYPAIRDFVEAIRQVRREMVIDSILFTLNDERGKQKLRAAITVSLQYFGNDTSKPASASAATLPPDIGVITK